MEPCGNLYLRQRRWKRWGSSRLTRRCCCWVAERGTSNNWWGFSSHNVFACWRKGAWVRNDFACGKGFIRRVVIWLKRNLGQVSTGAGYRGAQGAVGGQQCPDRLGLAVAGGLFCVLEEMVVLRQQVVGLLGTYAESLNLVWRWSGTKLSTFSLFKLHFKILNALQKLPRCFHNFVTILMSLHQFYLSFFYESVQSCPLY